MSGSAVLIELTEAIQAALDARLNQAHVALPGVVVSYNAARQTADIRPGVKRAVPTDVEGIFTTETVRARVLASRQRATFRAWARCRGRGLDSRVRH